MNRLLLIGLMLVIFFSCEDDFELDAPYQDIPVAYAYLDIEAENNFVRVQKAFLGTNGNAEVAAGIVDSIYYGESEATVSISVGNGDLVALEQVNGEDFGISRDTGVFANTPNLLYRLPASLNLQGGDNANLVISRPNEEDATASTQLLNPITIGFPTNQLGLVINDYRQNINIRWSVGGGVPQVYDIKMIMNIREFNADNPSSVTDRSLVFQVAENYEPEMGGSTISYALDNERFWQFLGSNLEVNPNVIRRFLNLEVQVVGVGQEIKDAIELAQANGGITSAQSVPVYTNVENGLGIFTSRISTSVTEIGLDARNADTLRNGIYTSELNFQ